MYVHTYMYAYIYTCNYSYTYIPIHMYTEDTKEGVKAYKSKVVLVLVFCVEGVGLLRNIESIHI